LRMHPSSRAPRGGVWSAVKSVRQACESNKTVRVRQPQSRLRWARCYNGDPFPTTDPIA